MSESASSSHPSKQVAVVIAANATGGHEFQARALVDDLSRLVPVTVFLNNESHRPLFDGAPATVRLKSGLFLRPGWLGKQVLNGLRRRWKIRRLLRDYDHVIVSAGAVEAGVCTSIALAGRKNVSLYLPFFYDRTVGWGSFGCVYNLLLGCFGAFYTNIITINRIQARLIRGFMHRPTLVIPNRIREVPKAQPLGVGRMLCICRLDTQKRVPELLRWLDFADNPYHEILVIGDGPQRDAVAKAASELRHIRARLLGWKEPREQDQIINSNDVLILNSAIEGEPLVIREANHRGILVLARDIPGIRGITLKKNRFCDRHHLRLLILSTGNQPLKYFPSYRQRASAILRAFKFVTEAEVIPPHSVGPH